MRDKGFFRFAEDFFEGADGEKLSLAYRSAEVRGYSFLPV